MILSFKCLYVHGEVNKTNHFLFNLQNALCNSEWMTEQTLQANQELDHEKSVLVEKVETLQSLVDKLQIRLSNNHKKQVKLFKVNEKSCAIICSFLP